MAIEPTSIQRDRMLAQGKTRLTLVQFLAVKDLPSLGSYFSSTERAIREGGGSRDHRLKVDLVLTRDDYSYQYLTVDSFPSSQALLHAHEDTREERLAAMAEIYALIVQPNPGLKDITRGMGFLSRFLEKWLGTTQVREFKDLTGRLDPETDPDPGKINSFRSGNLDQSCYMINLNQFVAGRKQGNRGKTAYQRYSARILPYLVSVGGFPDIYGKILSTYIGDQKSGLAGSWHDFGLVYYPTRDHFLRLMSNTPRNAAELRRAGLKRAVLMPCSAIP